MEVNFTRGLYGLTVDAFTRLLGWTVEEVQVFLVDVRKDIMDKRVHAYFPV